MDSVVVEIPPVAADQGGRREAWSPLVDALSRADAITVKHVNYPNAQKCCCLQTASFYGEGSMIITGLMTSSSE